MQLDLAMILGSYQPEAIRFCMVIVFSTTSLLSRIYLLCFELILLAYLNFAGVEEHSMCGLRKLELLGCGIMMLIRKILCYFLIVLRHLGFN
jgi:hypothetical protein